MNSNTRQGGYGGFYSQGNGSGQVGSSSNLSQRGEEGYGAASRSREDLSLHQQQRRPSSEARRPRDRPETMPPPDMPATRDYGRRPSNTMGNDGARSYSSSRLANGSGTNLASMNGNTSRPPMPQDVATKLGATKETVGQWVQI